MTPTLIFWILHYSCKICPLPPTFALLDQYNSFFQKLGLSLPKYETRREKRITTKCHILGCFFYMVNDIYGLWSMILHIFIFATTFKFGGHMILISISVFLFLKNIFNLRVHSYIVLFGIQWKLEKGNTPCYINLVYTMILI